jgi:hypothetical protein
MRVLRVGAQVNNMADETSAAEPRLVHDGWR